MTNYFRLELDGTNQLLVIRVGVSYIFGDES